MSGIKRAMRAIAIDLLGWRMASSICVLALAWLSWACFQALSGDFSAPAAAALTGLGVLLVAVLIGVAISKRGDGAVSTEDSHKDLAQRLQGVATMVPVLVPRLANKLSQSDLADTIKRNPKQALTVVVAAGLLVSLAPTIRDKVLELVHNDER